jgi:hypothetical protein
MRNDSRRGRCRLYLALLIAATAAGAGAEDGVDARFPDLHSALPEEAPTSIFNAKLGEGPDSDAELFVNGSWSSTVIGSVDLQAQPGSSLVMTTAQPLLFTQDPDLALSFLLYKRIFVEAKVTQRVSEAKYAAGYRGMEDEVVKEVRIGNDGINFPVLPFLSFGDGSYRSFGASALIGNDDFAGKAMVRYDQASRVTKRFVGSTEVTESVYSPNSFVSGKYFMTEVAPGAAVQIYVQSGSGTIAGNDGKKYRKLDASEYSYSATTGVVSLSTAATTRVLAYYAGSGTGADSLSLSGVGRCDWLYEPPSDDHEVATIDPKLQVLCRYATTATPSTGEAFVRNAASGLRDTAYQAEIDAKGFVEVTKPGLEAAGARASAKGANAYRRPFGETSSADMEWIYTTDFASDTGTIGIAPVYTRSVVVRTFSSSSNITIDKDYVAGSVEVTRNGVPDYAFTIDADSGILTLASPPAASEEIVVTYLKESDERKTGLVVGALGGFWDLGSGRSAWAAIGASWSLPGSSYTTGEDSRPGSLNLTGGERDTEGPFKSEAAIALRYSRDDSTGIYRVEGMESTSEYLTSFRQLTSTAYTDMEVAESGLKSEFPSVVEDFHKDGSSQKALKIVSDGSSTAAFYKIEEAPSYPSYKTFSFYAKLPPGASLTVKVDEGSSTDPASLASASVGVAIPADATRKGDWDRYVLHYGTDDSSVYRQDDEDSSEKRVTGASSTSPSIKSTGSRLVICVTGLERSEEVWIDEVTLEDSVGRGAFLFQGKASYDDPELKLGKGESPLVYDVKASTFAQGAIESDSYTSGGASISSALGFVGLGLHARTTVAERSTTFSGGHSIELPNKDFPVAVKDEFDYDPGNGAFGRSDAVALKCDGIAALSAKQESDWSPETSIADAGVLVQSWDNSLVFGPSLVTLGLVAKNRSLPAEAPREAGGGRDYGAAWIGSFSYAAPAFESSSDLREAKGSLSVKADRGEYLAASLGETTTPVEDGSGTRSDTASVRLAFPFPAFDLLFEPFYSRTLKEQRNESADGLVDDARAAIGDIADTPLFYRSVPFKEFFVSSTASDFAEQTTSSDAAFPSASYLPEIGIKMARESGSRPVDIVVPETISFSYGRGLAREDDTVTDSDVWKTSMKSTAVNVFGSMGSHPLGLPFDSDEYMSTLQADLAVPKDGSTSSYDLLYHGLSTFYAGSAQENRLDAESKLSLAELPSSMNWSGSLALSLSRRIERHWMLNIYNRTVKPSYAKGEGASGEDSGADPEKKAKVTSFYVQDLRSRVPIMRSTFSVEGGLSGLRSDAQSYRPGWSFSESHEAKLTVPERLTVAADVSLKQALDASTRVLTLGFLLSLNAVVSF